MNRTAALLPLAGLLFAASAPVSADEGAVAGSAAVAKELTSSFRDRHGDRYRTALTALRAHDWPAVEATLAGLPDGPMKSILQAEYFLDADSPRADLFALMKLIERAPDLPHADRLRALAMKRGAQALPGGPQVRRLAFVPGTEHRRKPRGVAGDGVLPVLRGRIVQSIAGDDPVGAEALLRAEAGDLDRSALTELKQRIAWSYYIENDDRSALRLAREAQAGAGEWVVHADWVAAMATWRLRDCKSAAADFDRVARRGDSDEMRSAGYYWASRADVMCTRPAGVQAKLQSAARYSDTFYGMLAAQALGMDLPAERAARPATFDAIDDRANVRGAVALAQLGEIALADDLLRHQAGLSGANEHAALLQLSRTLNLPRTQLWLAHHRPGGGRMGSFDPYPAPDWRPTGGWRVDRSLVFAHALQESAFRHEAVSPANAIGLMQVRPGTAGDMARVNGETFSTAQLYEPATNLEYGQRYLEHLSQSGATQGKLPKIIAAYNAGPGAVQRWNSEVADRDDPLLFIESIPYWETRGYVGIVLRNYWMYQRQEGAASMSLAQLSQNKWPGFPRAR